MAAPRRTLLRVQVDPDLCVGSQMCVGAHPGLFRIDDTGHASYSGQDLDEAAARDAAELCPMSAIKLLYED